MKQVQVSDNGGDRATAYAMSNKIVSVPEGFICTWIDAQRQNRWALVNRQDGTIIRQGTIGHPVVDNHCGVALRLHERTRHAIMGAHGGPFEHYVLEDVMTGDWRHQATLKLKGTYPGLACDAKGRLHLAYRSSGGKRWTLNYCRHVGGQWMAARTLVVAEKEGYIYWTNGMVVDSEGTVHLVFGNTRVLKGKALYYGASHIFSRDGGVTWRDSSDRAIEVPAKAAQISLITDEGDPERILSLEDRRRYLKGGPRNVEYRQILLSNPVIDAKGILHVMLHNCQKGTAALMSRVGYVWRALPLTTSATEGLSGYRIHPQSSLSLGPDGIVHAALMLEPTKECVWGPPGTVIARMQIRIATGGISSQLIAPPDASAAQWLPALEQPGTQPLDHVPPLLYTKGINAGGFGNNKNVIKTGVFLEMSVPSASHKSH